MDTRQQIRAAILTFLQRPHSIQSRSADDMFVTPSDIFVKADFSTIAQATLHDIQAELLNMRDLGLIKEETRESESGEYLCFALNTPSCPHCGSDRVWCDIYGTRFRQCPICNATSVIDDEDNVFGYVTDSGTRFKRIRYSGWLDKDTPVGEPTPNRDLAYERVRAAWETKHNAPVASENAPDAGLSGSERIYPGILAALDISPDLVWYVQRERLGELTVVPRLEAEEMVGTPIVLDMESVMVSSSIANVNVAHATEQFVVGVARKDDWDRYQKHQYRRGGGTF